MRALPARTRRRSIRTHAVGVAFVVGLPLAACGTSASTSLTLYTCISDTTIGPVLEAFETENPDTEVELYRAPTGDLNARIAADERSGGLRADVVWGCDPLSMQDYVDQGLVGGWTPKTSIPGEFRTDDYVGVALLYMLAISHDGVQAPETWRDLLDEEYADGGVALPDPSVAASALGALGYFANDPAYGTDFYARLARQGATQVSTPNDVVTGVAEGTYAAGITIAKAAYAAHEAGSPIEVSWPEPGAVAIYGPIALAEETENSEPAKDFISYVASRAGQDVLAGSGASPTHPEVPSPFKPDGAPVVSPDWPRVSSTRGDLLEQYQQIFGD